MKERKWSVYKRFKCNIFITVPIIILNGSVKQKRFSLNQVLTCIRFWGNVRQQCQARALLLNYRVSLHYREHLNLESRRSIPSVRQAKIQSSAYSILYRVDGNHSINGWKLKIHRIRFRWLLQMDWVLKVFGRRQLHFLDLRRLGLEQLSKKRSKIKRIEHPQILKKIHQHQKVFR